METANRQYDICGIPLDAQYFDVSGFLKGADLPQVGEKAVLAVFQIHPQYCGVLECFAQFTDLFICDHTQVDTPGLEWVILRNGQPLFPYNKIESIVNPWGYNNYTFQIRLEQNSKLEFAIFNRGFTRFYTGDDCQTDLEFTIGKVGGRLIGRYWYNEAYGNLPHRGESSHLGNAVHRGF